MENLQFIWWLIKNKGFKNFDSYLALNNTKRERLWKSFCKLN